MSCKANFPILYDQTLYLFPTLFSDSKKVTKLKFKQIFSEAKEGTGALCTLTQ